MAVEYYKYGSMNNWRANIIKKKNKGSRTDGKSKNENCQTDAQKKFFYCSPKAYKHPQYQEWHDKIKRINGGSKA